MAKVNFKRVQSVNDLSNLDIVDGNLIVTGDGNLFIDYNNQRIAVGGTPDIEMSDTSINPVQNKVVKEYVDNFIPKGVINTYAGSTAPNGWLICDGSAISRNTYSDLFNVIGTTYGTGDGDTTFNLPNLKGKIPVGYDISDSDFNVVGKTGGEKTHTISILELPKSIVYDEEKSSGEYVRYADGGSRGYKVTKNTNQPHNIMQPYLVMNYIIKY
jgi:microcystin-dependent protein